MSKAKSILATMIIKGLRYCEILLDLYENFQLTKNSYVE